ncbi:hypothetical protein JHK87_022360 [Glycine soja]|nr:hypothetical protein JHK87_022360 [Glycine soja]
MVEIALVSHERQHPLPKTADLRVQITGNFTPVPEHLAHQFLPVIGKIPKCIECVYIRNGANPLYEPVVGHHFFDRDDMVHVVKFHSGAASYACRFTKTQCLSQEKSLDHHVFPKAIGELHDHSSIARLLLFYARSRPSSVVQLEDNTEHPSSSSDLLDPIGLDRISKTSLRESLHSSHWRGKEHQQALMGYIAMNEAENGLPKWHSKSRKRPHACLLQRQNGNKKRVLKIPSLPMTVTLAVSKHA